ncbi:MAG: hypothetical protein OXB84_01865 [Halobacteriovoraceae bacterium]|nr:hypothetical protein [Halobacteriovoraceae bacterium]
MTFLISIRLGRLPYIRAAFDNVYKPFGFISAVLTIILSYTLANPILWLFYGGYLIYTKGIFTSLEYQVQALMFLYITCVQITYKNMDRLVDKYENYNLSGAGLTRWGMTASGIYIIMSLIMVGVIRIAPNFPSKFVDVLCYVLYFKIAYNFLHLYNHINAFSRLKTKKAKSS